MSINLPDVGETFLPTTLDQILAKGLNISQVEYQAHLDSQHSVPYFIQLPLLSRIDKDELRYSYDETDEDGLNKSIKQLNWQKIPFFSKGDDINSKWNSFLSNY